MIEDSTIEPAQAELAAPSAFAPKKNGSLDFIVDHRRFNAVSKQDSYSKPHMDYCTDSLGKATMLLTLDATSKCGKWK